MAGNPKRQLRQINVERIRAALTEMAATGSEVAAMKAGSFGRGVLNILLDRNPPFVKRWNEAKVASVDALEQEARRRAIEGVERHKFHKGQPIMRTIVLPDGKTAKVHYVEREYSDRMLEVLLKANMPEKYKDRTAVDHSGGITLEQLVTQSLEKPKEPE